MSLSRWTVCANPCCGCVRLFDDFARTSPPTLGPWNVAAGTAELVEVSSGHYKLACTGPGRIDADPDVVLEEFTYAASLRLLAVDEGDSVDLWFSDTHFVRIRLQTTSCMPGHVTVTDLGRTELHGPGGLLGAYDRNDQGNLVRDDFDCTWYTHDPSLTLTVCVYEADGQHTITVNGLPIATVPATTWGAAAVGCSLSAYEILAISVNQVSAECDVCHACQPDPIAGLTYGDLYGRLTLCAPVADLPAAPNAPCCLAATISGITTGVDACNCAAVNQVVSLKQQRSLISGGLPYWKNAIAPAAGNRTPGRYDGGSHTDWNNGFTDLEARLSLESGHYWLRGCTPSDVATPRIEWAADLGTDPPNCRTLDATLTWVQDVAPTSGMPCSGNGSTLRLQAFSQEQHCPADSYTRDGTCLCYLLSDCYCVQLVADIAGLSSPAPPLNCPSTIVCEDHNGETGIGCLVGAGGLSLALGFSGNAVEVISGPTCRAGSGSSPIKLLLYLVSGVYHLRGILGATDWSYSFVEWDLELGSSKPAMADLIGLELPLYRRYTGTPAPPGQKACYCEAASTSTFTVLG